MIVTTWQAAATIERSLGSALDEVDIALECIVVDDGSTDGTADIVASIAACDPRVTLERSAENAGVSVARNRALALARGRWLTFLDADDRLLPGAIKALVAPTGDPVVRCVVGQRVWSDGLKTWISPFYDLPDIRAPGTKSLATSPKLVYYASVHGKLFERPLLDGIRFEGRVLGDQQVAIRAMLRAGPGIEVISDDVYEWRRPPADRFVPTITSTTRRSAELLARAALVARRSYELVAAEIDDLVDDEVARATLKGVYAERLVLSDFSRSLPKAIDRRDPGLGMLFDALASLLEVFPRVTLVRSEAIYTSLLRPPWARWSVLPSSARRAYWRMLDQVRVVDPNVEAHVVGSRYLVPGLRLARWLTQRTPRLGGVVVHNLQRIARLRRRLRPT